MKCSVCGGEVGGGDKFCEHCGATVAPVKIFCEQCGAAMEQKASFCEDCGAPSEYGTGGSAPIDAAGLAGTPPAPANTGATDAPPSRGDGGGSSRLRLAAGLAGVVVVAAVVLAVRPFGAPSTGPSAGPAGSPTNTAGAASATAPSIAGNPKPAASVTAASGPSVAQSTPTAGQAGPSAKDPAATPLAPAATPASAAAGWELLHSVEGIWPRKVTFSPDGRTAVWPQGNKDPSLAIWDTAGGKPAGVVPGNAYGATAFSPDGRILAICGEGIRLLDTASWRDLRVLKDFGSATGSLFSPDGKLVATAENETIRLWDVATGQQVSTLKGQSSPMHEPYLVGFTPDGARLLTLDEEGETLRLWDVASGREQNHTKKEMSVGVPFSRDGRTAVFIDQPNVKVWDVGAWKEARSLTGFRTAVSGLDLSPDGRALAVGDAGGSVTVWDAAGGAKLLDFQVTRGPVYALAFSPDGRTLATGGEQDGLVRLWDAGSGKLVDTLNGSVPGVTTLKFSPEGRSLSVGWGGGSPYEFDLWARR